MKKSFAITAVIMCLLVAFASCGDKKKKSYDEIAMSGLTTRTENLKTNLKSYADKGILVGQMYGTLEGIGWQCDSDRSDIQSICGDRPAVVGYELAGIENGQYNNVNGLSFRAIREDILKNFRRGALLIMNWTMPDYQGKDEILEEYAKKLAKYFDTLQDDYGIKAPIVLNIMPIDNKSWYCKLSYEDYIALYKKVQDLLGDEKVSNVIYGYSETYIQGNNFMARYPDHNISVINATYLQNKARIQVPLYAPSVKAMIEKALPFAQEHNVAFGITTGMESVPDSSIFPSLIKELKSHRISYLMFGANYGEFKEGHYYTPYPGDGNDKIHGFMELFNDERTIFMSKLNGLYLEH